MTVAFRRVAYVRESNLHYCPICQVDLEINGKPQWLEMQAQTVICAQQVVCRKLGVPFSLQN